MSSLKGRGSGLLQLFGADAAQPGAAGVDASAALTHVVVARLTLAGENGQDAQGLQAPAAAARAVFAAAAFGAFPLHIQQLPLQLPDGRRDFMDIRGFSSFKCSGCVIYLGTSSQLDEICMCSWIRMFNYPLYVG